VAKRFQRRRFFGFLLDFITVQILWYFVGFLLDFGTVQILWYFVDFLLDFRIVQILWYFVGFLLDFGTVQILGSIYGRSSIMIAHFVQIRYQTWPLQAILVSDCLISKEASPLKPLVQMNRNLVGSILGRSSIKIAHLFNQKQELPEAAIFGNGSGRNAQS
jgi:hypothetical protein